MQTVKKITRENVERDTIKTVTVDAMQNYKTSGITYAGKTCKNCHK